MKHSFRQGRVKILFALILFLTMNIGAVLIPATTYAETEKAKATRWVNEFDRDCDRYTVRSNNNDRKDERCNDLKIALTKEPVSCSQNIVNRKTQGTVRPYSIFTINAQNLTLCKDAISKMKEDAQKSEATTKAEQSDACKSKTGDEKTACITGFVGGYNDEEKNIICPDGMANQAACKQGFDAGLSVAPTRATVKADDDIPCIGGAMGWIFCPIINYMADGIVAVSGFIDDMMQFKLLIGAQSGNGIRDTLNNFAGIANIMLVIAFLVIIFSQSTSIGLSNYNIKKMLPRIVIAAILINLSFYICAFAIDISNIAGNSIMGLISGQGVGNASVGQGIQSTTGLSGPNGAQKVFGAALGVVTGVILLIMFMGPLLLGIFLTFVILVARQVILLFLVITAPLAFAAWLLPNTESYFKKWKDLFINMLMIYPIIMLIFGVSLFAAKFISDPSIQNSSNSGALGGAAIGPIIVLLVLAIPLLALPFILKQSSSMLAKVGNAAQKYGGGQVSGMLGGKSREFGKNRALNAEMRAARLEGSDSRLGRAVGRAGGFRSRKTAKKSWAEQERKKAQQQALEGYLNADGDEALAAKRQASFAGAAATAGGAERVSAWAAGQSKERFSEAMKLEEAKLSSSSTNELKRALEDAILAGNAERAYAAAGLITSKGGPGASAGGEVISQIAGNQPFDSDAAKLAAGIVRSSGKEFNSVDPSLTRWADQDPTANPSTLATVSGSAGTYTGASSEKMATWNIDTATKAHQAAHSAGGQDWTTMMQQATNMLNSRYAENLSPELRQKYQQISNGHAP